MRVAIFAFIGMLSFWAESAVVNFKAITPKTQNNIEVITLSSSPDASSYIIFVRENVRKHMHKSHTELLYILEGNALFILDNNEMQIEAGDFIQVEPGQVHGVKSVISSTPLKLLSVQTPEFFGKDRHFIE